MMKFLDKNALMAVATGALVFSACSHETDFYNPDLNPNKAEYEKNWKNTFGDINPEQDWNVASKVTATVNLDGMQDAAKVMIYTGLPGGLNSRLVATYPAQTKTFSFDYEESAKDAYVLVTDSKERIILGNYFKIENGNINIAANTRGTRAGDGCDTSLGEIIKSGTFQDNNNYWTSLHADEYNNFVKYDEVFDLYKLNGVASMTGSSWKISDITDIVGKGGVFAEQQLNEKGECNLIKWEDELKPSEGAEYVMEEDGPMEITFMYGGTIKFNKFGYICYKDGATQDEILKAPRYLLMDDARPQHNVTVDGTPLQEYDGMKLPNLVESYEKGWGVTDATLTGTTYKLAYFDENGNSSFTFPAGTHIVFFTILGNNGSWWTTEELYFNNIRYSLPWMNKHFYYKRYEGHPSYKEYDSAQNFVTYRWNGQVVLGMEDEGGDDDMNDILFFINGKIKSNDIPDIGNDPEPQSWILACEDLGSVDDFDFNDVVFKVSHVSGQPKAEVTVLDAGGTLPATIYCGDNEIGEAHALLGVASNVMTTQTGANASKPIEIDVPADFSIAYNMGGFKIYVTKDQTSVTSVNAPGKGEVPQIICVPATWKWPKERVNISDAYPLFGEWGSNWKDNTWYDNCVDDKVISK